MAKETVIEKIDNAIGYVSEKIASGKFPPGEYSKTVKAFAELVSERANLTTVQQRKRIEKESVTSIRIEGLKQYKADVQEMKKEARELREEIEQLNAALEKEVELLRKLR